MSHVPRLGEKGYKVLRLYDARRDVRSAKLSGTDALDVRLHLCNPLTSCHLRPAPVSGTFFSRQLEDQGMSLHFHHIAAPVSSQKGDKRQSLSVPTIATSCGLLLVRHRRVLASDCGHNLLTDTSAQSIQINRTLVLPDTRHTLLLVSVPCNARPRE